MFLSNVLHPIRNLTALSGLLTIMKQRRSLMIEMTRREITERYAGQMFGALWAIGHPLFMMLLYAFIFGVVFKTRIGGTHDMPLDYTAYILSGLIPWMCFQESMTKACTAISGNASLVKQVVFPLEVLVIKGVIASMITMVISLAILIVYVLVTNRGLPLTYLLLPLLIIMQIAAMLGVAMLLSSIGVFFKDIKDFIQLFTMAGMYLMPVVYLPQWVPALFKPVLYVNPFSYVIWCYQDALYFGRFEHPFAWGVFFVGSITILTTGYRAFKRLSPIFGNAL